MILQYFENSSDATEIYDIRNLTTGPGSKTVTPASSDLTDVSDTTIKASQNNVAQSTSYTSDVSDTTATDTNKSADITTDKQNHLQSDPPDVSHTITDPEINSEQEPRNIYRLGRSDTWACENCRQKGDIHYMREHLCSKA